MRLPFWLVALAGVLIASNQASAQISYSYVTDQSSYTAAAGSTITVNLYLQETLTSGGSFITAQGGLFSAGAAVTVKGSSGGTVAQVLDFSQGGTPSYNTSGFTNASTNASNYPTNNGLYASGLYNSQYNGGTTGNDAELSIALGAGVKSGPTPDASGKILIGSIQVVVGSAGNTTTYNLTGLNGNSSGNLATADGTYTLPTAPPGPYDLDANGSANGFVWTGANNNPGTFTVVAESASVPEPSSMALCGLAICGMGFGAWKRRKARLAAEVAAPEVNPVA